MQGKHKLKVNLVVLEDGRISLFAEGSCVGGVGDIVAFQLRHGVACRDPSS
jgi:hypothetical protein